jgi:hypothetical protein
MWKTYGNGVAVFSRFDLLRSALSAMLDEFSWASSGTVIKT